MTSSPSGCQLDQSRPWYVLERSAEQIHFASWACTEPFFLQALQGQRSWGPPARFAYLLTIIQGGQVAVPGLLACSLWLTMCMYLRAHAFMYAWMHGCEVHGCMDACMGCLCLEVVRLSSLPAFRRDRAIDGTFACLLFRGGAHLHTSLAFLARSSYLVSSLRESLFLCTALIKFLASTDSTSWYVPSCTFVCAHRKPSCAC